MKNRLIAFITLIAVLNLRRKGVDGLAGSKFVGLPVVSRREGSSITIGSRFVAVSWASFQVIGVNHPAVIRTVQPGATLVIGDDCGMSGATVVAATSIRIGNGCLIGANATIVDTDFHPIHSEERRYDSMPPALEKHAVVIGKNVFIGANSIILKGSNIGDNSVVGAGSVVSGSFDRNSIIAGNPATIVGTVRSAQVTA
ncbi:acyltransferase [Arthrobacter sp. UNC362MFTsu5.1]|uniref:acyltransferase n=1 Tax=Arthrobacter sp. UNC362MFTsu5.1 TaxID=1449044 RepID=UPI0009DDFD75|nr:acyltransferase [Arthrobacter sp. UNC362MFTsu5.1]